MVRTLESPDLGEGALLIHLDARTTGLRTPDVRGERYESIAGPAKTAGRNGHAAHIRSCPLHNRGDVDDRGARHRSHQNASASSIDANPSSPRAWLPSASMATLHAPRTCEQSMRSRELNASSKFDSGMVVNRPPNDVDNEDHTFESVILVV